MNNLDILVPDFPESIINATVIAWHKKPGDSVSCGEVLAEIETEKVILEVPASINGILDVILKGEGTIVTSRQVLGRLRENKDKNTEINKQSEDKKNISSQHLQTSLKEQKNDITNPVIHDDLLINQDIKSSVTKNIKNENLFTCEEKMPEFLSKISEIDPMNKSAFSVRNEKRIPMTRLRKRIAERLLEAQKSTATLTTFNEVNMQKVMELRKKYGAIFKGRHNTKLGFMSFCVKAVVEALKYYPEINASIDGNDIIYHDYFDISIAVSTKRGLITPVLHNADKLSMADIEKKIKELAENSRNGKLTAEDLIGGNFTITNGGIFGSLISTPIINPPQSAILGIHTIKDRPMAVNGKVKILPMMYLALSYDHRLIDGRESINFLVRIKEFLEDPNRILLDI